ncbi:MBL fold metallo-hydrolase [Chloroflexota bacterium]
MIEVAPGIYQMTLPLADSSLGHINTYLVRGDRENLLVDTGWNTEETFRSLEKQLAEAGTRFEDITWIVLTHIHADHYGLAGRLKPLSPAKIAAHYLEKERIDSRFINITRLLEELDQWLHVNGVPFDELSGLQAASLRMTRRVVPCQPDVSLRGGEIISIGSFNFEVLWTPGHAPGHISLYEPVQKILLSGDHILPDITPNVSLQPQSGANPLADYLNSLTALIELRVDLILPGHQQPFRGWQARIDQIIRHHQQRNAEILNAIKNEAKTAYQISTEITWAGDVSGAGWQDLPPLDRRLAVLETLAHLEYMRFGGKLDKSSRNSLIYYQPEQSVKKLK